MRVNVLEKPWALFQYSALTEETLRVRLLNGHLQVRRLVVEFATHVDVGRARTHRSAGDEAPFDLIGKKEDVHKMNQKPHLSNSPACAGRAS